jgi:hypothetical protein
LADDKLSSHEIVLPARCNLNHRPASELPVFRRCLAQIGNGPGRDALPRKAAVQPLEQPCLTRPNMRLSRIGYYADFYVYPALLISLAGAALWGADVPSERSRRSTNELPSGRLRYGRSGAGFKITKKSETSTSTGEEPRSLPVGAQFCRGAGPNITLTYVSVSDTLMGGDADGNIG